MVKICRVFVALGLLGLAGSALAVMIPADGSAGSAGVSLYTDIDQQVLMQIAAGDFADTRREEKLARKFSKLLRKIDRYELRAETSGLKARPVRVPWLQATSRRGSVANQAFRLVPPGE
jgi:hypothetical protein